MSFPPDVIAFVRLVDALGPYLDRVVVAGGWAHRLHRLHPLAHAPAYAPLVTRDTDIALDPASLPVTRAIRDRLIDGGFQEEFSGEHQPPVTHYYPSNAPGSGFAEFLAPLTGGWHHRDGSSNATVKVGGVNAQRLRFIEVLLTAPWRIALDPDVIPVSRSAVVCVPNATSYLAQKILIHGHRSARLRAKDMLYTHDTIDTFANALPELRAIWVQTLRPTLHERSVRRVETAWQKVARGISDEAREASIQARAVGREVTAGRIAQVCAYGLEELFSAD